MPSTDFTRDAGLFDPSSAGTRVRELTSDAAYLRALLDVENAYIEAKRDLNVLTPSIASAISEVLRTVELDSGDLAVRARGAGNPVVPLVDTLRRELREIDPAAARELHLGATSQDIVDSALMLVTKRSLSVIRDDARRTVDELLALAERHAGSIMAGRTLTQHSGPITFGLKAAEWAVGIHEAVVRLDAVIAALPVQLAGASGTLASLVELYGEHIALDLPRVVADRLGLAVSPLPWHTRRTTITSIGDTTTSVADAVGTVAKNVALLSRTEIAELSEQAPGTGTSSSMPHKRNPVLAVLAYTAAMRAPGLAADLHRAAITHDERPDGAWHSEWVTLRDLLRTVAGAVATVRELIDVLGVDTDRMRRNLDLTGPLIVSERIMLRLGPVIGAESVRRLIDEALAGGDLAHLLRGEPALSGWTDEALEELLDPAEYLGASRTLITRAVTLIRSSTDSHDRQDTA